MIEIRPSWSSTEPSGATVSEVRELLALEATAVADMAAIIGAAKQSHPEDYVLQVDSLTTSASVDLRAGCELARAGYLKQAYALWRSWLEQSLFAFMMIEAPLERTCWRSVEEVDPGKEPPFKLMLHNVLVAGGEKAHPFAMTYKDRFDSLFAALRLNVPSKQQPVAIAKARLTDLSQAVHGTFRPKSLRSADDLPAALKKHATPVLTSTINTIGIFGFACVQSQLSLTEDQLRRLTDPIFMPSESEDERIVAPLAPILRRWLNDTRGGQSG